MHATQLGATKRNGKRMSKWASAIPVATPAAPAPYVVVAYSSLTGRRGTVILPLTSDLLLVEGLGWCRVAPTSGSLGSHHHNRTFIIHRN